MVVTLRKREEVREWEEAEEDRDGDRGKMNRQRRVKERHRPPPPVIKPPSRKEACYVIRE